MQLKRQNPGYYEQTIDGQIASVVHETTAYGDTGWRWYIMTVGGRRASNSDQVYLTKREAVASLERQLGSSQEV